MPNLPVVYVDPGRPIRDWLRAKTSAGARVFLGTPVRVPTDPWVVVGRVAGAPDGSEVPLDLPRMQCDCRAPTQQQAAALAAEVVSAVESFGPPVVSAGAVIHAASVVLGPLPLPEAADGSPRYVVDVVVAVTAVV